MAAELHVARRQGADHLLRHACTRDHLAKMVRHPERRRRATRAGIGRSSRASATRPSTTSRSGCARATTRTSARRRSRELMFRGHPYGRLTARPRHRPASRHARTTCKAHAARVFTRDRLTIGVAGGYPPDAAQELAQLRSSVLPATGAPRRCDRRRRAAHGPRFLLVEKQTDSTAISIGCPWTLSRADPDFAGDDGRAQRVRRAPAVQRPADAAAARARAGSTTATTRTSSTSCRRAATPPPRRPAARATSRSSPSGCARCRTTTACSRCAPRCTS